MGVVERKERERKERRKAIIDAAEAIFFKQGIENTSMDEVAQAAELSKGTVYLHFKSKDVLYRTIILRGFIILKRQIKEAAIATETGYQNVKAISEAYIKFSYENKGYFDAILYYQNDLFNSRQREQSQVESLEGGHAVIGVLINALQKGKADGSITPEIEEVEASFVLWSQITGLLQVIQRKMSIIAYQYKIKPDDLFHSYFDLLERSLKA